MLSISLSIVLASWTCAEEDTRIRAHLEGAYAQLVHATPVGLTQAQQEGRAAALERLRAYIEAGRFPRNHSERNATPVFVDEDDTHCAMGQLISELGGDEVVQHIRTTRNLETVPVLADEPGLAEWLVAHGMSSEEAALVQPTYFVCTTNAPCGPSGPFPVYDALITPTDGPPWNVTPVRKLTNESYLCVGEPEERVYSANQLAWPAGTVVGMPFLFAHDGVGWVSGSLKECAERPRMTDDDRLVFDPRECITRLAQRDLRWLAVRCFDTGSPVSFCHSDGRYNSVALPPRGTMRAKLEEELSRRYGLSLEDAGIDPAAYDAMEARLWELSDDGGMPLDSGVLPVLAWDGGVVPPDCACIAANHRDAGCGAPAAQRDAGTDTTPMPTGCGCHSIEGIAATLALLLFRRRPSGRTHALPDAR